jgi:hypothetical protein
VKAPDARFFALASWDGQQWEVRVEDHDDVHRGDTTAGYLDEVPDSVRVVLIDQLGGYVPDLPVWVEPQLPKPIQYALQIAEDHVADAARQVEDVATALRQANVPGHDIAAILAERALYAAPQRPLLIPNCEIAAYRLGRRPDVAAVEWPERGTMLICCRACVENNPRAWGSQPDGTSAAVYEARGLCDLCGRPIAPPEASDGEAQQ